jgi:nucleoid-associated protein YgaU
MTRENKLALVVGFALILFVGILVSDHFSAARTQQSANLLPASDPLVDARRTDPDLLSFAPPRARFASSDAESARPLMIAQELPADPLADSEPRTVRMPDLQRPEPSVALEPGAADALPFVFHEVRTGESLTSIARRHYGDTSLVEDLATYNDLANPDMLRQGHRLRIPPAEQLIRGDRPRPIATRTAAPTPPAQPRTYTVKPGDVLSTLAQSLMGSARHWRDLYQYNSDVIDDPDRLEVGVVIRVPPN